MKTNLSTRLYSLWGVLAFGLVICGAALSKGVVAQEQAIFVTGADVPPAYEKGNWKLTAERMRMAYKLYKAADWEVTKVPYEMWQHQDQKYSETAAARSAQMTGYIIPMGDKFYEEIAFVCPTYFRNNTKVYRNRTVSDPKGFFLVMFKDGTLRKIDGKEVRLIKSPDMPDAENYVYPGMEAYRADLPPLSAYQNLG